MFKNQKMAHFFLQSWKAQSPNSHIIYCYSYNLIYPVAGCDIRIFSHWPTGQWPITIYWPDMVFTGPVISNAKLSMSSFFLISFVSLAKVVKPSQMEFSTTLIFCTQISCLVFKIHACKFKRLFKTFEMSEGCLRILI